MKVNNNDRCKWTKEKRPITAPTQKAQPKKILYVLEPHLEDLYDKTIHVLSHETQGIEIQSLSCYWVFEATQKEQIQTSGYDFGSISQDYENAFG